MSVKKIVWCLCFFIATVFNVNGQAIQKLEPNFENILDSLGVEGSILILDNKENIYYSNDFEWANGRTLPVSTFKIPNPIIALELGIVKDENTILKWDGKKRKIKIWEQDLTLKEAFQYSCVPCYQKIAEQIGISKMKTYLKKLNYGKMSFDSLSLTHFWLKGTSAISQEEQIRFLKRLYFSELPISQNNVKVMRKLLEVEKQSNYTLSAKTGWTNANKENIGWYVGFLELKNNVYFFATNTRTKQGTKTSVFLKVRALATRKAINTLITEKI